MTTKSISLRTDEETLKKIDEYASAQDRSRNWWINQAIESAIAEEAAWDAEIRRRMKEADDGNTIPHDRVMAEMLAKYGES
ncbi:ribbon-helix-helix protein, CopG family [Psychromarinibacter sp. C21-152]|uniref:Ribbon-helix-helix protein, CopG family n=1 Tax=Psychromarinibacter sediminicola TaxID=3033385 RepID=A0AAE3NKH2_9RHOB|nr:ribbon-helix-helix protein, CopG family [Psychromarinibacter sediminicola]MDF0599553.1 ribbon-helix-helix protein, CopG family [Psychromarinibacter sediminicola]